MNAIQQLLTDHIDIWTAADTEKRSGRGRSAGNATSVYGIKKLRELILELAVRGKLVPQDVNDEPASELLKRIQAEKARLIDEGKSKKDKPLPPIGEEEKPYALPNGWEWVRNGFLFSLRKGRIPKNLSEKNIGLPYLDIEALDRGVVRRYTDDGNCPQSNEQDILVVCDGSRSGLVLDGKVGAVGSTLSVIDTPIFIQPFVRLIFKQGYERRNASMKGAAIPHLDTQKLVLEVIGFPPLVEQHRIVDKVDELMALCDQLETRHSNAAAAHEKLISHLLDTLTQSHSAADFSANWQRIAAHFDTLFSSEASIAFLKQTLLQLAVMGKLVPQDPNDESASELLKKIAAEKARLLAVGKVKKDKRALESDESEKPHTLPQGWQWVKMNEIATQITDGAHHTPQYVAEGIPFLSVKNLSSGRLDFSDTRFISSSAHDDLIKRCNPEFDDILLTKIGTTGIAVVIDDPRPFSIFVSVGLIKLPQELIDRKYLALVINSPFVRQQSEDGTEGVGNKNLVLRKINTFDIPIAPLAEQHRIVAKVDELMALCGQLKSRLTAANQLQQKLADVLVEEALA